MDDDPVNELHGGVNMAMMSTTRIAETLIRQAQENGARRAAEARRQAQEMTRRYEAQAAAADQFFSAAGTEKFVRAEGLDASRQVHRAAQEWAAADSNRFGPHADRLATLITQVHDVDVHDMALQTEKDKAEQDKDQTAEYDSAAARAARAEQIELSDLHPETKTALQIVDQQHATCAETVPTTRTGRKSQRPKGRAKVGVDRGR